MRKMEKNETGKVSTGKTINVLICYFFKFEFSHNSV